MNTKTNHAVMKTQKQWETVQLLTHSFDQKKTLENLFVDTIYDDAFQAFLNVLKLNVEAYASHGSDRQLKLEKLSEAVTEAKKHEATFQALHNRVKRKTPGGNTEGTNKKQCVAKVDDKK